MKKSVSILGLGHIGAPLAQVLSAAGYVVKGSTRSPEKAQSFNAAGIMATALSFPQLPESELLDSDLIVLNIPPFEEELDWFRRWNWRPDSWMIFLSSTSVYEDKPLVVTEDSEVKPSLLSAQEKWVQKTFPRYSILRLGGLLGGARHPGKHLSGRKDLKSPLHAVNLVHHDDVVGFIQTVMEKKLEREVFNVVSDEHRSRKDFYQQYAKDHNLALPEFDESDKSLGKIVSNQKMKGHYQLKHAKVS